MSREAMNESSDFLSHKYALSGELLITGDNAKLTDYD